MTKQETYKQWEARMMSRLYFALGAFCLFCGLFMLEHTPGFDTMLTGFGGYMIGTSYDKINKKTK